RPLYGDLVDIKPPLPYLLYALAERMVGFGASETFLLGLASAWATLFGLYWLAAHAFGRWWLGIAAAAFWVILGSDLYLQANQPNTEVFINAFMVCGIALLWTLPDRRVHALRCVGIGVLFGCASLCKTVAIVPAVLLLLAQLIVERRDFMRVARQVAVIGITMIALWLVTFAWLASTGTAAIAWQILVEYPAEYARITGEGPIGNILGAFSLGRLMPGFFMAHACLVLVCLVVTLLQFRNVPVVARMLAWAIGIFIAVALPGQFTAHYYQLWLPWLCVALALACEWIATVIGRSPTIIANSLLFAFAIAWCAFRLWPQYRLDAVEWSIAKYKHTFVGTQELGRRLGAQLKPAQSLFVFGVFPGMYEAAGREPKSGVMNVWLALPRYGGSLSADLSSRVLAELQSNPPDLIVLDAFTCFLARSEDPAEQREPIREWIGQNYRMSSDRFNYSIVVRGRAESETAPADPCPATTR
ncbi:MAG: ArnT family glycosyltransferase, partial [Rhodanobacteraceae bacterium]